MRLFIHHTKTRMSKHHVKYKIH